MGHLREAVQFSWTGAVETERWESVEQLQAALRRFTASVPGYVVPAAYGLGHVDAGGVIRFPQVNRRDHPLPAVVLAGVCGYRSGTQAFQLQSEDLDRAIELLAPAEACTYCQHPNLWSWRAMRSEVTLGDTFVAVFVSTMADPEVNEADAAFRDALG
jgi:hypothetical protein